MADLRVNTLRISINDNLKVTSDIKDLLDRKWNVESPNFARAAKNLGIEIWELKLKRLQQFQQEKGKDAPFYYNIHLKKLRTYLNDVIEERRRIMREPVALKKVSN